MAAHSVQRGHLVYGSREDCFSNGLPFHVVYARINGMHEPYTTIACAALGCHVHEA